MGAGMACCFSLNTFIITGIGRWPDLDNLVHPFSSSRLKYSAEGNHAMKELSFKTYTVKISL